MTALTPTPPKRITTARTALITSFAIPTATAPQPQSLSPLRRVNDAPLATDDSNTTNEDTQVSGDVSKNDTPSGDGGNTWSVVTNPAHGTLTFNNDGTYTYMPEADYNGTDSFNYQLCDIDGDCSPATVTITIGSINDLPLTTDDSNITNEDTASQR